MKKRVLSLLLALVLAAGATANAAFTTTRAYTQGQFTDVPAEAWYAGNVKRVYELGLMNGSGDTTFNPSGMFTVAEALTVAGRMHSLSHGGSGSLPSAAGPWYQNAVDYCLQNKLIADDQFDSYTRAATRAEMAGVIRAALPDDQWKAINSVTALPDVNMGNEYAQAIFDLYNAGVFTGSDDYGMFQPYAQITRAEVAAIVARCADPSQRKVLTLKPLSQREAPEIIGGYRSYLNVRMSNGRLAYQDPTTKKWGYLDGNGNIAIPAQYDWAGNFHQGRASVSQNGKSGVINTAGTVVVPLEYEYVSDALADGAFVVEIGEDSWGLWKNGNLATGLKGKPTDVLDDGIYLSRGPYTSHGVIDSSGKEIVPCEYGGADWTGFYGIGYTYGEYVDVYDQNGVLLAENTSRLGRGNPLYGVKEGNKWAVAVGGTKITEAVYDNVYTYYDKSPFATVKYGNQVGLVGMNGEIFAPGIYDDFKAKGKYVIVKKDGKDVGVADATGLLPGSVEDYLPKEDNTPTVSTPEKTYQIKTNDIGKPIVSYGNDKDGWTPVIEFYKNNMYYDEIRELGEGYYACRFNTTWYLVHA